MAERAGRGQEPTGLRRIWREYGLSVALFGLFLASFVLHAFTGWMQYSSDQASHGQQPTLFGDSGYVWYFGEWTFQNWQSEFLELATIVALSSVLIHRGSAESKDSDDEMKALLESIEKKLDAIERGEGAADDGRREGEEAA